MKGAVSKLLLAVLVLTTLPAAVNAEPGGGGGVIGADVKVEQCRTKGKIPLQDFRRTLEAILPRHQNGDKWRSVAAEMGP